MYVFILTSLPVSMYEELRTFSVSLITLYSMMWALLFNILYIGVLFKMKIRNFTYFFTGKFGLTYEKI